MDLALALEKRRITKSWKSARGPSFIEWEKDVTKWAGAEGHTLRKEDSNGIRRSPIAHLWDEIMEAWLKTTADAESDTGDNSD
ncbi:hypothetical protein NDU88_004171 [Pleurodeles waltl]|uniref:Uncharacterized protein n=1 Tax=Pleurodeles waltl TaxID=8319 RepID=A0AAV7NJ24_PLEWA|nr:hypothetical protein NDU88_004171 [Pleurodeles waltl]